MGDVRNWEELFERYSPAVFGYLHRMSDDRHLAEDLTSETFYRAMRASTGSAATRASRPGCCASRGTSISTASGATTGRSRSTTSKRGE